MREILRIHELNPQGESGMLTKLFIGSPEVLLLLRVVVLSVKALHMRDLRTLHTSSALLLMVNLQA